MHAEAIPQRRSDASSRVLCFIGITALAAACATDDVASPASGLGDGAADAGLCPGRVANEASTARGVWARSPETSDCCRYETFLLAPRGWPYFDTEAECRGSCRCSVQEGFNEMYGWHERERTSLECRCSAETCPSTVAEAEQLLCSHASSVMRSEGCGRVMIDYANGATGESWIFERPLPPADAGGAGERLIGGGQLTDVPIRPCQAFEWLAGRSFECEAFTTCQVCGEALASIPPCE